jgi:tetratricopeptide (TPR) repeat protein
MKQPRSICFAVALLACACGGARPDTSGEPAGSIEDGETLIERGEWAAAAELFARITAESPDSARAFYYLGLCREQLGDAEAAERNYREAIRLDGGLLEARNNLGLILLEAGDLAGAEAELAAFLEKRPGDAAAHYNYGLVMDAMGRANGAREQLEKAHELDPEDPDPLIGLGDLAREGGDRERALDLYRRARETAPEDPVALLEAGRLLLELERFDEAAKTLAEISKTADAGAAEITTAGMLLARFDRDREAIELYRAAVEKDGSYATAHLLMANALARRGEWKEAAGSFERYLELAPDSPEAEAAQKGLEVCREKAAQ